MNELLFLGLGLGLGLALGLGVVVWQRLRLRRSLERILPAVPADTQNTRLSPLWKLRRGVAWLEETNAQFQVEAECWRAIVKASPIGYLQVDGDNYLQRSNAAARAILGLPESIATPRLLLEVVRSYELDRLIEKTRTTGHIHTRHWIFHPTSTQVSEIERSKPVALCGHSIILSHGHIGVWLENQQEMAELRESRDRWVADLAHELRTPLTSIRLVAETLERRLDGSWRHWAGRLVAETDRLIALVQDWLDLTKPDAGTLAHQPFTLADLIGDVWSSLEPIAQHRQISLTFQQDEAFVLTGSRDRLFRVFLNLLDNAIQYSPDSAAIAVTAYLHPAPDHHGDIHHNSESRTDLAVNATDHRAHQDRVVIDIIDSGSGFRDDDLPHVFDRLYRGDRARVRTTDTDGAPARHTSGSGLGLAIVEQIVQAHDGTVTARNVPQGTGAWLQVVLPLAITPSPSHG